MKQQNATIPICEKSFLTMNEAMAYTGIGRAKLTELCEREDCTFVLWNGKKRLLNRKRLDEYLKTRYSI